MCLNITICIPVAPVAQRYLVTLWHVGTCCCCCCCCFSHSAYWLPTRKNYFTRWPIPLVVCWTGKREQKKKSGSIPPPPTPHTARSEKINKITRRIYRRYAGGRSRVRTRIPSARRLGLWVWLRNSTLPSAIIRFPVSLLLSSPGDV